MIMVLDVGNTNTKCGLFENGELLHSWRMATKIEPVSYTHLDVYKRQQQHAGAPHPGWPRDQTEI